MTQISPRLRQDITAHRLRMRQTARRRALAQLTSAGLVVLAFVSAAAIAGYLIGGSAQAIAALPELATQSPACTAW